MAPGRRLQGIYLFLKFLLRDDLSASILRKGETLQYAEWEKKVGDAILGEA